MFTLLNNTENIFQMHLVDFEVIKITMVRPAKDPVFLIFFL